MKKQIFFQFILYLFSTSVFAQVSEIRPNKIYSNDDIILNYNSNQTQAKLNGAVPIFARITNYLQDGSVVKINKRLIAQQGKWTAKTKLPATTASCKVEFYTLNKDDEQAGISFVVYDQNNEKPVKGAYLDALFSNNPDSVFRLELANYPRNFLAYAKYIHIISMVKDPISAKPQIEKMLVELTTTLSKTIDQEERRGLLSALCIGKAKTGNLHEAKKYLFLLFENFPKSQETAFTFSQYDYEYYKASGKQVEEDVKASLAAIFTNYPDAAISKDSNVFEYLKDVSAIKTEDFERVIKPMMAEDRVGYYALNKLPELYISRKENLAEARKILEDGIKKFQDGTINHQYRLGISHYQMYVPILLFDLAKIYRLENNFQSSIQVIAAAIQVLTGSSAEGNFLPMMLKSRAEAYAELGNFNLAMEDYKKMYLAGDTSALDSMKQFFALSNVKFGNFEDFVASLQKTNNLKTNQRTMLNNFTGVDLNGNPVSLLDFRGKIVVINVWGTGCGPCIAEMPVLNELVKKYVNHKDVVFLGVTADENKKLAAFFKTKKFDYRVLSNVKGITELFNTNALPVHLVVGRNGEIINRSVGARADIASYLSGVIDRIL